MQPTCNHQALHSLFSAVRRRKATTPAAERDRNQSQSELILYNLYSRITLDFLGRSGQEISRTFSDLPKRCKIYFVIGKIDFTSFVYFWCLVTRDPKIFRQQLNLVKIYTYFSISSARIPSFRLLFTLLLGKKIKVLLVLELYRKVWLNRGAGGWK